MDWFLAKPALVTATQDFIQNASNWDDPLVAWCNTFEIQSDRIAWLLLGSVLHQGITLEFLVNLLKSLRSTLYEQNLAALPATKEAELVQCVKNAGLTGEWILYEQFPGIVWSVGCFIRNRGVALDTWIHNTAPRDIWRACGEIHFMGKNSAQRPKALAFLYRVSATKHAGLGVAARQEGGNPPFPVSMGARRWMAWVGPYSEWNYADASPAKKMTLFQELYRKLCPDEPWKACHGLQFYTEPLIEGYLCMENTGTCSICPLNYDCPRAQR